MKKTLVMLWNHPLTWLICCLIIGLAIIGIFVYKMNHPAISLWHDGSKYELYQPAGRLSDGFK